MLFRCHVKQTTLTLKNRKCEFYLFPKLKEFMKGRKSADNEGVIYTANGCWKTKIKNSSTTESELWRNAGPSAFQLKETMLKSDKI